MPKLASIESFLVPPRWLFVRIETDDGAVGWGEASLEGHAEAVVGALEAVRDRVIGLDADRIEDIWQMIHRLGFYRGGPVLLSALSGLDQALWDLKGKRLGVPVSDLLGGRVRDRMRVYAWIGGDRPGDVADAAAARLSQGFDAVNMNGTGHGMATARLQSMPRWSGWRPCAPPASMSASISTAASTSRWRAS